tara:strand:- start:412 stop:762 length:351 start_codon:yes stop_codon:yes gene_type:complete
MKVSLLKEKAKSLGIKGYYKMKKQELLDSIKEIETVAEAEKPEAEAVVEQPVVEEVKPNYTCKFRKGDGILEFPLNEVETDRDALREFVKWFSTQQDFLLGELFKNDKKIRQIRRR